MKDFFDINGKAVMKLYINQIAMSVFGIMVIFASAQSDFLVFLASVLSVGLYLFIIYSMMWEQGARAAAKTLRAEDAGTRKIYTPFMIVLFGSLFNILCYLIYTVLQIYVYIKNITEGNIALFGNVIWNFMRMINGIYMGFESFLFPNPNSIDTHPGEAVSIIMHTPFYYFFLTLIPLFAIGIFAYYMGASEISILRKLGFKIKNKYVSNTHIDYSKNKK
ncbi:MAG: hypothetical protein FWF92_03865 [Oscillospiraceae bacterium]|nr:hypothetical protein [Oscillospiraceae bacterium]